MRGRSPRRHVYRGGNFEHQMYFYYTNRGATESNGNKKVFKSMYSFINSFVHSFFIYIYTSGGSRNKIRGWLDCDAMNLPRVQAAKDESRFSYSL